MNNMTRLIHKENNGEIIFTADVSDNKEKIVLDFGSYFTISDDGFHAQIEGKEKIESVFGGLLDLMVKYGMLSKHQI